MSSNRNASRGSKPNAVKAAQLVDPIMPLEPVPDDQAAITFLKFTHERNQRRTENESLLLTE